MRKCAAFLMAKNNDDEVIAFLKENPNPSDDQVHDFAEKIKMDVHDLEKVFYGLATMFVRVKTEGMAAEKGFTEKDADPGQLKKGIKIEREHIKDDDIAKKIALDHLAEIPDYYDRLEKMEKEAEK